MTICGGVCDDAEECCHITCNNEINYTPGC